MDLHTRIDYPDATPEQVFALIVDPGFRRDVAAATQALDAQVDVRRQDDGGATVTVSRTLAATVPDFARRFVGDTLRVVQTEQWSAPDGEGGRSADVELTVQGQPARFTGRIVLAGHDEAVHEDIRGDVRVSIPFVGKKLEAELARGIVAAAGKEQEIGRARLGEPG
jgi:hypothetical protein